MESETTHMIVENVKIYKIVFMKLTFARNGSDYLRNVIVIAKRTRSLFVFIVTTRRIKR